MWFWEKKRLLDYVEREGRVNAEFHIKCADDLFRSANILLAVLLSGAGGASALFVSLLSDDAIFWLQCATAASSVYLFVLSGLLVTLCISPREIYAPANEPGNIYDKAIRRYGIDKIREFNIRRRQDAIDKNIMRNDITATWLNRVQTSACVTPVVFIFSGVLAYLV